MAWAFTKTRRITKRRHSEDAQAILDRLAAYLHDSESEPVEMLCGFWKDQQDAITYQEMRTLVLEGYVDEVTARLWQQDYSDLVKNRMPQIWNGAMIAGSKSQPLLTSLPNFAFNLQTPGVIRWIQSRGAEMVTVSTQRQKDAISLLLEDKMRNSHTVDELARLIRPCVGLYRQQAAAVSNFYDHMVKTLTEQHPRTKPERIQLKALDKATKYAERLHRQRAVTIAQTEMAFAYNYGADEGIRQAQADFLIGRCEKIWSTSGDDRVCPDCAALDGQRVGMEDTFFSGNRVVYDENGLYPPRHPRCACAVQYVEIEPPPFRNLTQEPRRAEQPLETLRDSPSNQIVNEAEDVLSEYLQKATPGIGTIAYDNGYDVSTHTNEVRTAQWLLGTFGGAIKLLTESTVSGVKMPDYLWDGKLWDLKNTTSEKAADSAIRSGLKQVRTNPGGIILDYGEYSADIDQLYQVVQNRMRRRHNIGTIDILVKFGERPVAIWRYEGRS